MIAELEFLIALQQIDLQISEQNRAKEEFPATIAELQNVIRKAQAALDGLTKKQQAVLNEKKTIEEKISLAKASLDKSQDLLNSIKTNREYDAVHTQIENFKQVVSGGDARLKTFDQDAQQLQQAIEAAQANLDNIKAENDPKIAEITAKVDVIDAAVNEAVARRDAVVAKIPKALLRTYQYILKGRKNGKVLSFITEEARTCSVCFKVLEPQLVNEIRKAAKVIICQNCGSLYVWKDEPKA
ncbi:MAG TPA: C4-type zinc ribbon domain-containing protein [Chitinivibrionales bacterium]